MRRHDQPVDDVVGGVGQREHGPVAGRALVVSLDLDAPHDAVRTWCRRNLEILALVAVDFHCTRKVERHIIAGNLDRFHGIGGSGGEKRHHRRQDEGKHRPVSQEFRQNQPFVADAGGSSAIRA